MAIMGLPNCSCFIPVATHNARAPAILRPSVQTALRNWCFIFLFTFKIRNLAAKIQINYQIANYFGKLLVNLQQNNDY